MMLFHEVYGIYFRTLESIISQAQAGRLTEKRLTEIIRERALPESVLTLLPAVKSGSLAVIDENLRTSIRLKPAMPLTLLEKRWLKTLLNDPRARLFGLNGNGLDDVEPLYSPDDFYFFDRYLDGDPYGDPRYIAAFQTILRALDEDLPLKITFTSAKGNPVSGVYRPVRLEYSAKDDKFRLLCQSELPYTINLSRIDSCDVCAEFDVSPQPYEKTQRSVSFELTDDRNALERAMLSFSDLRKQTRRISSDRYLVTLWYDGGDETELVIRIISFGPMLLVVEPDRFVELIRERLARQRALDIS